MRIEMQREPESKRVSTVTSSICSKQKYKKRSGQFGVLDENDADRKRKRKKERRNSTHTSTTLLLLHHPHSSPSYPANPTNPYSPHLHHSSSPSTPTPPASVPSPSSPRPVGRLASPSATSEPSTTILLRILVRKQKIDRSSLEQERHARSSTGIRERKKRKATLLRRPFGREAKVGWLRWERRWKGGRKKGS